MMLPGFVLKETEDSKQYAPGATGRRIAVLAGGGRAVATFFRRFKMVQKVCPGPLAGPRLPHLAGTRKERGLAWDVAKTQ